MYTLYHHLADPFSRKVRLMLAEKGLEGSLRPRQKRGSVEAAAGSGKAAPADLYLGEGA